MSDPDVCLICGKDLKSLNDHNKTVHQQSCIKKKGRKRNPSETLFNYFKKQKSAQQDEHNDDVLTITENNDNDIMMEVIEIENESAVSRKTASCGVQLRFCDGFSPSLPVINLFQDFPFQLMDTLSFTLSKKAFHTKRCSLNNFIMDIGIDDKINADCASLKFDTTMESILNRANDCNTSSHIKDSYLSYNQLKNKLEDKQQKLSKCSIEKFKLKKRQIKWVTPYPSTKGLSLILQKIKYLASMLLSVLL